MAYSDKPMLEDVNGKPIPQYYDPVDDEFKPLTNDPTKVQLTGSRVVEKHIGQSVEVSGGSGIGLTTIDISDAESFTFGVKGTSAHDFEVTAQRRGYAIGYLDHSVNDRLDVMSITSKTTALSDKFDVTSPLLRFFISNNGIDTQVYDATLYKIGSQVMGE